LGAKLSPKRERSTAGVESGPKSSIGLLWNMETLPVFARSHGQTSPQGGSGAAALRGPKKPMPGCNALDMPTSAWSEMTRKQVEPLLNSEKQMTANARWLMRPRATIPRMVLQRRRVSSVKSRGSLRGGSDDTALRPYDGLSRMKGNFHVRFLGECGRGNPPALTRSDSLCDMKSQQALLSMTRS